MAAKYTVIKAPDIPLRDERLLVREHRDNPHITDPWDMVAPGLYPDETVVQLDTGDKVAVSVEPCWKDNGEGVRLIGFARWLEDDGSTKLSPDGRAVEVCLDTAFTHDYLADHPMSTLSTEIVRLMLGETPTRIPLETFEDKVRLATAVDGYPEGTTIDLNATERDLVWVPKEAMDKSSIRDNIQRVKEIENVTLDL